MKNTLSQSNIKTIFSALLLVCVFIFTPQQAEAQFLKKLKDHAEKKIKQEAEKRAEKRVDNKIDKVFDAAENVLDGKKEGEESNQQENKDGDINQTLIDNQLFNQINGKNEQEQQADKPIIVWSQYDFIPGDQIVFEDGPAADEENGEFPSRWDLVEGSVEIGEVNGENVIMFLESGKIVPYLKNSKEDYLPEVFTIEMDVWFEKRQSTSNRYFIKLRDDKNQGYKGVNESLTIYPNGLEFQNTDKRYPGTENLSWSEEPVGKWRHIAIAYTEGKFKAYMDDTRLINVPHLEGNPWGITINALNDKMYLKNIRIAKGGVKYYSRVLSEGKIIVNGIKFDINKATLRPESMGPINEIAGLMQSNPDLNFSIEGHTDSDGETNANQSLSEARAKTVMEKMITMGIDPGRLKYTGWGESKPIGENGTAEGKANNRRVEFVKFTGRASSASNSKSNSEYYKINNNNLASHLDNLPGDAIQISNNKGIITGQGSIIVYATSDGNLGKMQILDVDKNDNYKLTIKYVTYNADGSVHSKSDHLEVKGTYNCDLDKGNAKNMIRSDIDFQLGRQDQNTTTIYPGEISILKVFSK